MEDNERITKSGFIEEDAEIEVSLRPKRLSDYIGQNLSLIHIYAISQIKDEKMTPELMALRGRCEVSRGKFSDALKSFDAALAEDAELKGVRIMKGMILQSKRDYEGALNMYDEALKMGDDPVSVCSIKAALLYEQERNAELLVFRSDAAKMPVRSYDVDGYTGLVRCV